VNRTEKEQRLLELIGTTAGSGIVYVATVKRVEELRSGGIAEAVTHVGWNSRLQQLKESPDIHRN